MKKNEFLAALEDRLACIPAYDTASSLEYYAEMIDDRIEDGLSEEEAVAAVGSPQKIAERIISELPPTQTGKAAEQKSRTHGAGEILLLILGAPLWLPLLLAAAVVLLAIYIVLWAAVISIYALTVSLGACSVAFLGMAFLIFLQGNPLPATALIGFSLTCAGLCILFGIGSHCTARGLVRGTSRIFSKLKSAAEKKEAKQ